MKFIDKLRTEYHQLINSNEMDFIGISWYLDVQNECICLSNGNYYVDFASLETLDINYKTDEDIYNEWIEHLNGKTWFNNYLHASFITCYISYLVLYVEDFKNI